MLLRARVPVCVRVPVRVCVHMRVFSMKACLILVLVRVRRPPWQLAAPGLAAGTGCARTGAQRNFRGYGEGRGPEGATGDWF